MHSPFGWSLPPGCTYRDIEEAYGIGPAIDTLSLTKHTARYREHICSECFMPIKLLTQYRRTVYKDCETGKISQYKVHFPCCPWEDDMIERYRRK